jgi:hypothetical protein
LRSYTVAYDRSINKLSIHVPKCTRVSSRDDLYTWKLERESPAAVATDVRAFVRDHARDATLQPIVCTCASEA